MSTFFAGRRVFLVALAVVSAAVQPLGANAGWPDKPIRIIVPFPAGGSTDSVARLSGEWLWRTLGQPVTVENRTGASGTIAAEFVAQAPRYRQHAQLAALVVA